MARFQQFTADLGQTPVGGSRRATAADFGGMEGAALAQLGQAGNALADNMVRRQEDNSLLIAQRDAAALRERMLRRIDELQKEGQPLTERVMEDLESELQAFQEGAGSNRALLWAQRESEVLRASVGATARKVDSVLAGQIAQNLVHDKVQADGVALQSEPDMFMEVMESYEEFVDALDVPEQMKPGLLRQMQGQAAKQAIRGRARQDANLAKALVQGGQFDQFIDPDERNTLLNDIDRRIRALDVERDRLDAEARQRRAIESDRMFSDLVIQVHTGEIGATELIEAGQQEHDDGSRMISGRELDFLLKGMEARSSGESIQTPHSVRVDVLDRMNSITEEELVALAREGDVSGPDLERWLNVVRGRDNPLGNLRASAIRNLPENLGVASWQKQFMPILGKVEMDMFMRMEEGIERFRQKTGDPMDYFRDEKGHQADLAETRRAFGQELGIQQAEARAQAMGEVTRSAMPGMVRGGAFLPPGVDPSNAENWISVQDAFGQGLIRKADLDRALAEPGEIFMSRPPGFIERRSDPGYRSWPQRAINIGLLGVPELAGRIIHSQGESQTIDDLVGDEATDE